MEPAPVVVLLHEGELDDAATILDALDVEVHENAEPGMPGAAPDLVVGTPVWLLAWQVRGDVPPVRIAVCEGGSRTLDHRLQAAGVDYVLRRPVHPAALRLLLLHALYRGPERRQLRRAEAGVPVRVATGWRRRRALLLEFSTGGCRVLVPGALAEGDRIKVTLPEALGLGRTLGVTGRVLRCEPALDGEPGEHVAAVEFDELGADVHQRLAAAVVARAHKASAPAARAGPSPSAAPAASVWPDREIAERRHQPRARYERPVRAEDGGEHRVLMGANLSPQGMRVAPDPRLCLGDRMQLELFGSGDVPPVCVEAEVARNDGDRGLYLAFRGLWPGAPALLDRIVRSLPLVSAGDGDEVVISRVLDVEPAARR